jgi:hypothetical protein
MSTLVKMSPRWSSILASPTSICPCSALSHTRWYLTSMCLLHPLSIGFLIKVTTEQLSTFRLGTTGSAPSSSPKTLHTHYVWQEAFSATTYSDSQLDCATMFCLVDCHEIGLLLDCATMLCLVDCHEIGLLLRKNNTTDVLFWQWWGLVPGIPPCIDSEDPKRGPLWLDPPYRRF